MAERTQSLYASQGLTRNFTKTTSGSTVCSYSNDLGPHAPILTLFPGYPQSAFIWRHIVPQVKDKVSVFIAELPGYGISTPCETHSKRVVGGALLEALEALFGAPEGSRRKVILGGHDRGARICHRLVVQRADFPNLDIIATILMDIVPTKAQWEAFANPQAAVAYFHWPFLANAAVSAQMIQAFGGDKWCQGALQRIQGKNEAGQKSFAADGAHDVYSELFAKKETIEGSCADYADESMPEVSRQTDDLKNGRKVDVPLLVLYSKAKLGAMHDVEGVWQKWIAEGVRYRAIGIGPDIGHYLPEEAPKDVGSAVLEWIDVAR